MNQAMHMAHLDPVISFVTIRQLMSLNPREIMGLAIPKRGDKVQVAVLKEFEQLLDNGGLKVSIPEWSSEVTIIESIHVTSDGLVFVCAIGGSPELNALGREAVEVIVNRMELDRVANGSKEPVMTFFTAVQPAKNAVSLLYKREGVKLRYCYTIMGIPNLRIVSNDYLIYSHREEIRKLSLNGMRRGMYLATDYICHTKKPIIYLGKPSFGNNPYVPMTLADGKSVKLRLSVLESNFKDTIFSEENLPGTIFQQHVNGVIGKLAKRKFDAAAIYGAVQGNKLILMPRNAV